MVLNLHGADFNIIGSQYIAASSSDAVARDIRFDKCEWNLVPLWDRNVVAYPSSCETCNLSFELSECFPRWRGDSPE